VKFTEAQLEQAIIDLMAAQGFPHTLGTTLERDPEDVLLDDDLRAFLGERYKSDDITENEIAGILRKLKALPASDLYESNKQAMRWISNGFDLKREDRNKKDLHVTLIDYDRPDANRFRIVNQLGIDGSEHRIPDAILYVNGMPLVVFEFKSAIREEATLASAYDQLTTRYRRDTPALFVTNALCVISDGVNTKMGSFFATYDFWYAWRKVTGDESVEHEGIDSLHSMVAGLFDKERLLAVVRNFIYFPDTSQVDDKIVCRYPQYYAATKLHANILAHMRPHGDGKGGTYFGATGCGKSFTMLFLARLLMRDTRLSSPTLVVITDRTDLDDQMSKLFVRAKQYIGDEAVVSVQSRAELRELMLDRRSGGVFLTTIHKFTEDTELLTDRTNVICISDEAHRSQVNLDQKIRVTDDGVKKTWGFAKYLHESLPNATYVGFTGTPIDKTTEVFGPVVDRYTMSESVRDEITVRIVYEGRADKVVLDNSKLAEIEEYYEHAVRDQGASQYHVDESKRSTASMDAILADPDHLHSLANDFVAHYEKRVEEGSSVAGKCLFVFSRREIAWEFYNLLLGLRPEWGVVEACLEGEELSEQEAKKVKPMARVAMVMTRGENDSEELYNLLGSADHRKELDRQFKQAKSNFRIALVVDMWLTGFDVPFLDTIYINKPLQKHSLIQTISRVNRRYEGKAKGLVVDYIGIKKQLNTALGIYSNHQETSLEEVQISITQVRDHLDLLNRMFHGFDLSGYFNGAPLDQLACLNKAAERMQKTEKIERRFMDLVKRMKAAYDICSGNDTFSDDERDRIHFYLAVRSIIFKLTKGNAPDTAQMNAKVREMVAGAIQSQGVEEIFKLGDPMGEMDLFDADYLEKLALLKLPNTKVKLLQKLLQQAIGELKKVNKVKGVDFSKQLQVIVDRYNERDEDSLLVGNVLEDFADDLIALYRGLEDEMNSPDELGITFEEKAFYDILKSLMTKYDFTYPEDKLLVLAKEVKDLVESLASYSDWNQRDDIKAELKAELIMLLAKHGYPPVDRDEVYHEIFEQAENFKANR